MPNSSYVRTPFKSYVRGFSAVTAASITTTGNVTVGGRTTSAGFSSSIDGDATTPAVNWSSDTNSGLFRQGADNIRLAVNGTAQVDLATSQATCLNHFQNNGTLFQVGNISMSSGAKVILDASSDQSNCPLQFNGDPNTGLIRIAADQIGVVAAGGTPLSAQNGAANASTFNVSGGIVNQGFLYMHEMAAPGALADYAVIYAVVDGGSKTDLVALFQTGAAQTITQEP